jgi:hypothetical protein
MLRKLITPNNQDINIHIPENFIGKELEVLIFPLTEIFEETTVLESSILTHHASEAVLSKDWLSAEEDKAWKDL